MPEQSSSEDWVARMERRRAARLRQEFSVEIHGRDREWWRAEAKRTKTDWSSLLRQRLLFKWWINEGRPHPRAEWLKGKREEDSVAPRRTDK